MGGKGAGLTPHTVKVEGVTHWFLRLGREVIDPTADQFDCEIPYHASRGRGFLTKRPSKRTRELLRRVESGLDQA